MIPHAIAKKVLLIGPDYKDHRGGIGAVIGVHKGQYEVFNFIPSFKPYSNNVFKSLYFIRQLLKIAYQLASNRDIRIVHIHSSKRGSLYRKLLVACLAKKLFRKKTINHIHTGNFQPFYEGTNRIGRKAISYFLRLNDATITVSEPLKRYCETVFQLKQVYKVNNMVSHFGPPPGDGVNMNGRMNLLFLGLLHPNKGVFDLLEVVAANKQLLAGRIKLFIGGNGQVNQLQERIGAAQLEDLVEYKGWVSGAVKYQLLQQAHVFVLPSYHEGIPMAILEAMDYGKPVIATAVGGIPELVQPGENGCLVNPGDHTALLQAILFYLNDRENIVRHGAQATRKATEFLPERIVPQLTAIYRSLL